MRIFFMFLVYINYSDVYQNESLIFTTSITAFGVKLHTMEKHRIYTMSFASVYPLYITKAEKKGRTKAEVDEVIHWLTGYTKTKLEKVLKNKTDFETFFKDAPKMNKNRSLITGKICGVQIEEIKETTMREIRYLDKLVDELAKGRPMEKILRKV